MKNDGTNPNVEAGQIAPSPDFDEFIVGAGELDVSSIGNYPVRFIEVVSGTGVLKVWTAKSVTTARTASSLAAGSKIGPTQITSIRGTGDGSSALTIRVYK